MEPIHHVGVDENGLGPRLGPMIVTAVTARVTPGAAALLGKRPRGGAGERLGDSKRLVSFEDSGLGEAWGRAVAKRAGAGALEKPTDVLRHLALDSDATLRAMCPAHHEEMCWSEEGEALTSEDALGLAIGGDLDKLAARGIDVIGARVAIVCAKGLNDFVARGLSRFHADLHTMERLVAGEAARVGAEVVATCGKVGGFDRYGSAFGKFVLHTPLVEGRARSEYRVPGVGTVAFVRDAEDGHILVAMASLIGKWARDLLMRRIVRFHRAYDAREAGSEPGALAELREPSGYHDPVTTRFIAATSLLRGRASIADECFIRRRLEAEPAVSSSSEPPEQASSSA